MNLTHWLTLVVCLSLFTFGAKTSTPHSRITNKDGDSSSKQEWDSMTSSYSFNRTYSLYVDASRGYSQSECGETPQQPCVSLSRAMSRLDVLITNDVLFRNSTLTRAVILRLFLMSPVEECNVAIIAKQQENLFYFVKLEQTERPEADNTLWCKTGDLAFVNSYRDDLKLIYFRGMTLYWYARLCWSYNLIFENVVFESLNVLINYDGMCPGGVPKRQLFYLENVDMDAQMNYLIVYQYEKMVFDNVFGLGTTIFMSYQSIDNVYLRNWGIEKGEYFFQLIERFSLSQSTIYGTSFSLNKVDTVTVEDCEFIGRTSNFPSFSASFGLTFHAQNIIAQSTQSLLQVQSYRDVSIINFSVRDGLIAQSSVDKQYNLGYAIISVLYSNTVVIQKLNMTNNTGIYGTMYLDHVNYLTVENSNFLNGNSEKGGAIYFQMDGTFISGATTFYNCLFSNNQAKEGGAVFMENVFSVAFKNCIFNTNTAVNSGGALFVGEVKQSINFEGTLFKNNTVLKEDVLSQDTIQRKKYGSGGAVTIMNIFSSGMEKDPIQNVIFDGNSAFIGGAFFYYYVKETAGRFKNVMFKNNRAYRLGSAVFVGGSEIINRTTNTFLDNSETSCCGDIGRPIEWIQFRQVSPNIVPGQNFTIGMLLQNSLDEAMPTNIESFVVGSLENLMYIQVVETTTEYAVLQFYMRENATILLRSQKSFGSNLTFTFRMSGETTSYYPVTVTGCPENYELSGSAEVYYSCVPKLSVGAIIAITFPIAIFTFIVGAIVAVMLLQVLKVLKRRLTKLKLKERAEEEMQRKLNDKNVIFDLTPSEDETTSSFNSSLKKRSNRSDLSVPLIEKMEMNFIIPIEDITIEKRIGEGGSGCVYLARWRSTHVAIKSLKIDKLLEEEDEFDKEATILSRLRHENIVQFYGVCLTESTKYLVTEYLKKSSLDKLIYGCRLGSETISIMQKLNILFDVANGMDYLHNLKPTIVHRDLVSLTDSIITTV